MPSASKVLCELLHYCYLLGKPSLNNYTTYEIYLVFTLLKQYFHSSVIALFILLYMSLQDLGGTNNSNVSISIKISLVMLFKEFLWTFSIYLINENIGQYTGTVFAGN